MATIDSDIFRFVEKIKPPEQNVERRTSGPTPPLYGQAEPIHLGEVSNYSKQGLDEEDGSITSKFVDIGGKVVGLNEKDFKEFKNLLLPLLDEPPFASMADAEFILTEAFNWLITVFKSQRAETGVITHLLSALEASVEEHHFYFKVYPLSIQERLTIGNVDITLFMEEDIANMLAEYQSKVPTTTLERFREEYGKNLRSINAFVKVTGVLSYSEEVAKHKAELAIDVLKCFCIQYSVESLIQMFDLDYRLQEQKRAFFLHLPGGRIEDSTLQMRSLGGVVPIELRVPTIEQFIAAGLPSYSAFIKTPKPNNELYDEILSLIRQLAVIVSTFNNFEKVIKGISLMESFLVPKAGTGKAMGLTRIKKVLPHIITKDAEREKLAACLPRFYDVRDKYLHNYRLMPFKKEDLIFLLHFERVFILRLIKLNESLSTVEEVHNHLGLK